MTDNDRNLLKDKSVHWKGSGKASDVTLTLYHDPEKAQLLKEAVGWLNTIVKLDKGSDKISLWNNKAIDKHNKKYEEAIVGIKAFLEKCGE